MQHVFEILRAAVIDVVQLVRVSVKVKQLMHVYRGKSALFSVWIILSVFEIVRAIAKGDSYVSV